MANLGGNDVRLGYASWIGIGEETTFGVKATANSYFEFNSESLKLNRETIFLESINTTRDITRYFTGNEIVEGNIEVDLNIAEDGIVKIIKQAFGGTVTSSGTSTAGYTHILNLGDMENNQSSAGSSDTKSLTISVQKGNTTSTQFHFVGCRINNLTIAGEINAPIKMTADILGKTATNTAESHTVIFSDIKPLFFTGITIQTGDSTGNLTATSCIGFEFALTNNLASDANVRSLGSRNITKLPPLTREATLKLTMRFDTTTAYTNFLNETSIAVKIIMSSGETIGSDAGSTTYSMYIECPTCYLTGSPIPEIGEKGPIVTDLEFKLVKENTTSAYLCKAEICNATANY